MAARWTGEERELLRELWPSAMSRPQIAARVGRSTVACARMAERLGLGRSARCEPWTGEDDATLRAMLGDGSSVEDVAAALDRTVAATRTHIRRLLGCTRQARGSWSVRDLDAIGDLRRAGLTDAQIAARVGRSVCSVAYAGSSLRRPAGGPRRHWTEAEDDMLRARVDELGDAGVSALLNRTESAVRHRRIRLGISMRRQS